MGWKNYHKAAVNLLFYCNVRLSREEVIDILHVYRHRFGSAHKRNAQAVVDRILEDKRGKAA